MTDFKLSILFTLFTFFTFQLAAQDTFVSGIVLDEGTGEAIEYATIALYQLPDSTLIDGQVSDEEGRFRFEKVKASDFYLSVQFMGYQGYLSEAMKGGNSIDLGDIRLGIDQVTLDEIVLTGRSITQLHKLDKQVFDAGQFANAKGGTASDVLANLPSVSINSFGEISVRGASGFQVMLNGKPIQGDPLVVLQQLAANSIEDIEVITAPSAKYDPDGKAGIINIKTKKGVRDGFFLNANVLLGLPSIEAYDNKNRTYRYGADLSTDFKQGRWNFSAGLNYRRYDISGRREGYVNTTRDGILSNTILTEFPSDGERSFDEETYAARLSAEFSPAENQTITGGFYAGKRSKDRTADILYNQQRSSIPSLEIRGTEEYYESYLETNSLTNEGSQISSFAYFNENLRVRKGDFLIASLDYDIKFKDDASLTISGLYERTVLGGPTDNISTNPTTSEVYELQYNDNDNPLDGWRFQTDYRKSLGAMNWESGYQFKYLNHPGDFIFLDRDLDNETWVENPLFTNAIKLTRSIHSLYTQLSEKREKFEYQIGLRGEYFDRSVYIENPENTFNLNRFNLFPSANLGYDLGGRTFLKAAYSRRIERTTTFKMTPFPEREHSETLEQGDAELLPEYIDLVELGVVKNWQENTAFATMYYRHVENLINRVNTVFNDTILNRIYTNVGSANVFGLELGSTLYPKEWCKIYLGSNIYNYSIKGELFGEDVNTSNLIYSFNINSDFNLSPTFSAQFALNYLSERVTAQGVDSRFYNPSLSLRRTFANKRFAATLQWNNIDLGLLNSNEQRITTVQSNFYTTTNYVYEVDIVQLSLTYQFNQPNKKLSLPNIEFGKKEF